MGPHRSAQARQCKHGRREQHPCECEPCLHPKHAFPGMCGLRRVCVVVGGWVGGRVCVCVCMHTWKPLASPSTSPTRPCAEPGTPAPCMTHTHTHTLGCAYVLSTRKNRLPVYVCVRVCVCVCVCVPASYTPVGSVPHGWLTSQL